MQVVRQLEYDVLRNLIAFVAFLQVDHRHLACKVCPTMNGEKVMRRCHAADHAKSKKHQRNLDKANRERGQQMPFVLGPLEGVQSTQSMWQDEPLDEPFEMYDEGENPSVPPCSDEMGRNSPALPHSNKMERNPSARLQPKVATAVLGDPAVSLSQLWEEFQAERTVFSDDYFDEIQRKIESGEPIFSSVLPFLEEEPQLGDGDDSNSELLGEPGIEAIFADYGIDIDGTRLHQSLFYYSMPRSCHQ